jgi:hypothetical protein
MSHSDRKLARKLARKAKREAKRGPVDLVNRIDYCHPTLMRDTVMDADVQVSYYTIPNARYPAVSDRLRDARLAQVLQGPIGVENCLGVNYDKNYAANTCNAGGWHFQ